MFIADGKVYMGNYEHSPENPKPRGAPFTCVNATTGEEIWKIDGVWPTSYAPDAIIGDSTIALLDVYDNRIYAYGKGPSATTVTAPDTGVPFGTSVMIRGTVTDVSPGTKDDAVTMRFPNGVPAVADEYMGNWMLHVYKQFERPSNTVGVTVSLDVVDANGNYRNIGTATSDANGVFSFSWQPDIPGEFTVYATFAGSKSYYGSFAETAFVVDEAVPVEHAPEYPQPIDNTMTIVGVGVALGILIAIVGVALALLQRKR